MTNADVSALLQVAADAFAKALAERDQLRARLAETERERDEARAALDGVRNSQDEVYAEMIARTRDRDAAEAALAAEREARQDAEMSRDSWRANAVELAETHAATRALLETCAQRRQEYFERIEKLEAALRAVLATWTPVGDDERRLAQEVAALAPEPPSDGIDCSTHEWGDCPRLSAPEPQKDAPTPEGNRDSCACAHQRRDHLANSGACAVVTCPCLGFRAPTKTTDDAGTE